MVSPGPGRPRKVDGVSPRPKSSFPSTFSWDEYLKQTNSKAAPPDCFKQSLAPLPNTFQVGMKLEATDPRSSTSTCIATVVEVMGPRILLRLDGSDAKNDFWKLVDSANIQPMGTCENKDGEILQPPVGYGGHVGAWPKFRVKTLTNAVFAPKDCFLKQPETPSRNRFEVGMKLEAVDRKNLHLVCVATVVDVKGDKIHVAFDGYGDAFNYWTTFRSRDVFPVGWCKLNQHPLQQPENIDKILSSPSSTPTSKENEKIRVKTNSTLRKVAAETKRKFFRRKRLMLSESESESETETLNPTEENQESEILQLEKSLYINPSCCWGAIDESTFKSSLPEINGIIELEVLYKRIISIFNESMASNPKSIKIEFKKKRFRSFEQFATAIAEIVRLTGACKNLISFEKVHCYECSVPETPVKKVQGKAFRKREASQRTPSDSAPTKTPKIAVPESTTIQTPAVTTGTGNGNGTASASQVSSQSEQILPVSPPLPIQIVGSNDFSSSTVLNLNPKEPGLLSNPKDWTVGEVIKYIASNNVDMTRYANAFWEHEIDGKAMLLLNSDMMCSSLGLTLGAAVKIYHLFMKFRS